MCTVAVLMSTYNGERYLKEQIDSILNQTGVHVDLYIRDDGSRDDTVAIIEDYCNRYSNIHYTQGVNVGVGISFMQLVYDAPEHDFYAFSDQDDVWLPQKLSCAVEKISATNKPILYASNQIIVDKELNRLELRYVSAPDVSFQQIICQNRISGCTMVWNKSLQEILSNSERRPSEFLLRQRIHDVWVAMVAAVTGEIIYDENGYILYRQHGNNVVGVKKTKILKQWILKLKDPSQRNGRRNICKEIIEKNGDLIKENCNLDFIRMVGFYTELKDNKIRLLSDKVLCHKTGESRLGFQIKVLFNII